MDQAKNYLMTNFNKLNKVMIPKQQQKELLNSGVTFLRPPARKPLFTFIQVEGKANPLNLYIFSR